MHEYIGACACGRLEVRLRTALTASQLQPRSDAPTCGFCRAHDGVWISDPAGTLQLRTDDPTRVTSFASNQVQFHFCPACDTLAYATFADVDRAVAVVRVALFDALRTAVPPPITTNFDGETVEAARLRRLRNWTPVERLAESGHCRAVRRGSSAVRRRRQIRQREVRGLSKLEARSRQLR